MARRLLTVAIFLLLGAVVNVAVAWGCAIFVNPYQGSSVEIVASSGNFTFQFLRRRSRGTVSYECTYVTYVVPDYDRTSVPTVRAVLPQWVGRHKLYPYASNVLEARGWPRHSLSSAQYRFRSFPVDTRWGLQTTLRSFSVGGRSVACILPLRPIWPDFAINTLFYAAILWLVIPGPFALRRFARRRRGLCVACGYDLRHADHNACPDCGVAA